MMNPLIVNKTCLKDTFFKYSLNKYIICVYLGILATIISVYLNQASMKYILAATGGMVLVALTISMGNLNRRISLFLIFFVLSIPLNIDINLFLIKGHVGGASCINISISFMVIFALYTFVFINNITTEEQIKFGYNKLLFWAPILYMLSGFVSLINAAYPKFVFLELIRLIMLFSTFFYIMNIKNEKFLKYLVFCLCACVFIEAVIAILQYKTNSSLGLKIFGEEEVSKQNIGFTFTRATGTIGHPNSLGYFFEILLPLIFAMFLVEKDKILKSLYFVFMLTGILGIYTTLSRGAWITIPVSFSIVFALISLKNLFRIKMAIGVVIFILIGIVGLYFAYPTIKKRFLHKDGKSAASRKPLNMATLSIIKQFPIVGVGLNNFSEVFKKYDKTGKSRLFKGFKHVVHNLYLLVWAEVGTIGFIAFLWIFGASFITALKIMFKVPIWYKGVLVGIVSGITAHLIHGLFDPGFVLMLNISVLIYTLIGIIGSISIMYSNSSLQTDMSL